MIDKITTLCRSNFGVRVGRAPTTLMEDMERSLMVFLGLTS
jgi:mRNA interferase MazF